MYAIMVSDGYLVGPFKTKKEAQDYIDSDWEGDQLQIYEMSAPFKDYQMLIYENKGDKDAIVFECSAEDWDHAAEQAINAYPHGEIKTGWLVGTQPKTNPMTNPRTKARTNRATYAST